MDELTERFSDIEIIVDQRTIDHGDIVTAGRFMAWVDLGLKFVDQLLGPTIAVETARYPMVEGLRTRKALNGIWPTDGGLVTRPRSGHRTSVWGHTHRS